MSTELRQNTKTRTCAACTHFMPSIKEAPGRGLCALYSLIVEKTGGCKFGYQPRPVRDTNRAPSQNS